MKFLSSVAVSLLLATNAFAATVVVDFEDVAAGTGFPATSHGFNFSGSGSAQAQVVGTSDKQLRVNSLDFDSYAYSYVAFSQQGLVPFDLSSFWMEYQSQDYAIDVTVSGSYANGGGTIQQQFHQDFSFGGLVTLGVGWTNLKSASITILQPTYGGNYATEFYVDDITVSTVPVPAAAWLLGSGLGLLGWFRRKQTA